MNTADAFNVLTDALRKIEKMAGWDDDQAADADERLSEIQTISGDALAEVRGVI